MVEDETTVGNRIERLVSELIGQHISTLKRFDNLDSAQDFIESNVIDLLLLDLNLQGRDGFELLRQSVAGAFHTIINSAYAEKALQGFEHGVLDFVAKPFSKTRLKQALDRFIDTTGQDQGQTRYLAIKKAGEIEIIELFQVRYIRGADCYTEVVLKDGQVKLHDKTLTRLNMILPPSFARIHKSYIVNMSECSKLHSEKGSKYGLELNDGERLPVGRTKYKEIMTRFF